LDGENKTTRKEKFYRIHRGGKYRASQKTFRGKRHRLPATQRYSVLDLSEINRGEKFDSEENKRGRKCWGNPGPYQGWRCADLDGNEDSFMKEENAEKGIPQKRKPEGCLISSQARDLPVYSLKKGRRTQA